MPSGGEGVWTHNAPYVIAYHYDIAWFWKCGAWPMFTMRRPKRLSGDGFGSYGGDGVHVRFPTPENRSFPPDHVDGVVAKFLDSGWEHRVVYGHHGIHPWDQSSSPPACFSGACLLVCCATPQLSHPRLSEDVGISSRGAFALLKTPPRQICSAARGSNHECCFHLNPLEDCGHRYHRKDRHVRCRTNRGSNDPLKRFYRHANAPFSTRYLPRLRGPWFFNATRMCRPNTKTRDGKPGGQPLR